MTKFNHVAAYMAATIYQIQNRRDERGATAVEYGLLVGLIAVAIIVTVTALGTKLSGMFSNITSQLPTVT